MSLERMRPWAFLLFVSSVCIPVAAYDAPDSAARVSARWQQGDFAEAAQTYKRKQPAPPAADDAATGSDFGDTQSSSDDSWRPSARGSAAGASQSASPGRWRAQEVTRRPERGAYPDRPYDSTEAVGRRLSQRVDSSSSDYDSSNRSRIDAGYGAKRVSAKSASSPGVKRVWTEEDGVRVKTVYDENGEVVYRKGWSKKTGEEVPLSGDYGRQAMPRGSARGKKDYISEDAARVSAADRRERRDLDGLGRGQSVDGPHHLRHRDVVERDGPTEFSLALPVWYNTLTGSVSGPAGSGTGAVASHNNTKPGFEFAVPHLGFGYMPIRHNTTVAGTFTFQGTTYAAGSALKFDADMYDLWTRWGLIDWHVLHLDWMLGSKVVAPNFVATNATGATSKFSQTFPIPYLGIVGQFELDRNMLIKGAIKYSSLGVGNAQENMTEAEIALAYEWGSDFEFSKLNQVSLGYRIQKLDVIDKPTSATGRSEADVDLRGPFAKVTAYF
ncbi:MAG: hypothetical protein HY303_14775 [Candidatus Wallbacteria bacterium]|nr:hypothetical protein [Candidatus Wallbacteria bacterium]